MCKDLFHRGGSSPTLLDVVFTDSTTSSYRRNASRSVGSASARAERRKVEHYREQAIAAGYHFKAFGVDDDAGQQDGLKQTVDVRHRPHMLDGRLEHSLTDLTKGIRISVVFYKLYDRRMPETQPIMA